MPDFEEMLLVFKALSNENRLKIISILADGDCTVRELAELTGLKEPTVSEHLNLLKEANLVTMRAEGNFRFYAYNAQALAAVNQSMFSREKLSALAIESQMIAPQDQDEQKFLRNFMTPEGRLKTIPASRKQLKVLLKWLVRHFDFDRQYSEKEVNAIITQYHDDYATLRRELVSYLLLRREKGVYWRPQPEAMIHPTFNDTTPTETR